MEAALLAGVPRLAPLPPLNPPPLPRANHFHFRTMRGPLVDLVITKQSTRVYPNQSQNMMYPASNWPLSMRSVPCKGSCLSLGAHTHTHRVVSLPTTRPNSKQTRRPLLPPLLRRTAAPTFGAADRQRASSVCQPHIPVLHLDAAGARLAASRACHAAHVADVQLGHGCRARYRRGQLHLPAILPRQAGVCL